MAKLVNIYKAFMRYSKKQFAHTLYSLLSQAGSLRLIFHKNALILIEFTKLCTMYENVGNVRDLVDVYQSL